MKKTLHAFRFLFVGPLILLVLFAVNMTTSPGNWWIKWPALGIGLAWMISLLRVLWALLIVGGVAALATFISKNWRRPVS